MQEHRTAPPAGSVRGLGVCDALRVELVPEQLDDVERVLSARIAALEARGHEAGTEGSAETHRALLRMRVERANLPVLVGPSGLVIEIAQACMGEAVLALSERLRAGAGHPSELSGLARAACAVAAWVATLSDCREVEGYTFEPGVDPAGAF